MSDTPLYSALCALSEQERLRFHMPGHKGNVLYRNAFLDAVRIDYTELPQTGNLYKDCGPISESEALAAEYFGASKCAFLTGGSTQGIMAALSLVCRENEHIIVDRNCHRSVTNTCGLIGITPYYFYPEMLAGFSICRSVSEKEVLRSVENHPDAKAVVVTSPTYYGAAADLESIAKIVHSANMMLIVDEAHGAHFPAIGMKNAIQCGADLAVCSAHKTMPALTQGAYLLANESFSVSQIRRATSLFGTSSPSYLVMASLDLSRAYLCLGGGEKYRNIILKINEVKLKILKETKFRIPVFEKSDPCRLTVDTAISGLTGFFVAECLRNSYKIDCEMADRDHVIFIITCEDSEGKLELLCEAFLQISKKYENLKSAINTISIPKPVASMSIRKALFSKAESCILMESDGKIAAEPIAPYPPGIPVILPGERIDRLCIEYLLTQGYNKTEEVLVVQS